MKYLYATQGHHKDIYDKPEKEKVRVLSLQLQYIQHPGYNSFSHISATPQNTEKEAHIDGTSSYVRGKM